MDATDPLSKETDFKKCAVKLRRCKPLCPGQRNLKMVAAAFARCRSHSRRAGCRGCGAGVKQQTARASGVRLRPPGAINETPLPVPVCVAVSVFRLALMTLKTGDAGFWPVGGHAIFCRRDIPCEMCEDIPCAKVCPSGRWIVRSNRSTTRGWGWRYW